MDSKVKELYDLAEQLQSVRDELTEKQIQVNMKVDKFQERISDVFRKVYSAINLIERGKCDGEDKNYGVVDILMTTSEEEQSDNGIETKAKHPRLDKSKNVDEKALMFLEADKIPAQLEHLSSNRLKKTVDWRNCNIYHGLKNIMPDWHMINGKLLKTYECWCGVKCPNYISFQKHFDNCSDSKSEKFSCRCVLCGKGFRKDSGLLEHAKMVHGIIPQAEPENEDNAIHQPEAGGSRKTDSVIDSSLPNPFFRGNLITVPIQVDAKRRSEMVETWRDSTSKLLKVTPYCVLLDSQLNSLAENPPASKELLCDQLGEPQVELLGNFIHTLFRLLSEDGEVFFEQMQNKASKPGSVGQETLHGSEKQLQKEFHEIQKVNPGRKNHQNRRRTENKRRNRKLRRLQMQQSSL